MKKILSLLILLSLAIHLYSQTSHSGNVSGTWYTADNPHIITGNVTIPSASTLTLEPGVEVRTAGRYTFLVNGVLLAEGTTSDSIKFTRNAADETTRGMGIRFENAGLATSKLKYCIIEYGNADDGSGVNNIANYGGGVFCNNSPIEITHSRIRYNRAMVGGGIYIFNNNKTSLISENIIENNLAYNASFNACGGGGISAGGDSLVLIKKNIIKGNTFDATGIANFEGGGGVMLSGGRPSFINNTVYGNSAKRGSGILISPVNGYSNAAFLNNIVWGNTDSQYNDQIAVVISNGYGSPASVNFDISYSCIQDSLVKVYTGTTTSAFTRWIACHSQDPLFEDAANGNFILTDGSPCIDTGNPEIIDDNLSTSKGTNRSDMGGLGGASKASSTTEVFASTSKGYLKFYPNPNNGNFNLDNISENGILRILSIDGRIIGEQSIENKSSQNLSFPNLQTGLYIIQLILPNEVKYADLLIQ